MKPLSPHRIVHSRNEGVDKVYIHLQEKDGQPFTSSINKGHILYNEHFHWVGVEFTFQGNKFTVLFDPSCIPAHKEENEFKVESNTYGIRGVECINGIINGMGKSHPFSNEHTY